MSLNGSPRTTTTLLDIESLVSNSQDGNGDRAEEGLFSVAVDPQFSTNGYIYLAYAGLSPYRLVVERYTLTPSSPHTLVPASNVTIFETPAVESQLHKGGLLRFGSDQMLYLAIGDDHRELNAQDLTSYFGKVLRIDVSFYPYVIPADNPFFGIGGGVKQEIWAYGFRHPWRFSFDRLNGEMWLGDVGNEKWEEINKVVSGGNYGWSFQEGNFDYNPTQGGAASSVPALTGPVFSYKHSSDFGNSVTGGYVYRGTDFPQLYGKYVFADYISGKVFALEETVSGASTEQIAQIPGVVSISEDEQGELYFVSIVEDKVYRLRAAREEEKISAVIPKKLSQTGILADTAKFKIAPGLVRYDVQVPLWSDGADKDRWIGLPEGTQVTYVNDSSISFPVGTTFVKHFSIETSPGVSRRLETRLFYHHVDGWQGYAYRWNDDQTDANLVESSETVDYNLIFPAAQGGSRVLRWFYPSTPDCNRCHTDIAGAVLGANGLQLNHDIVVNLRKTNQLDYWNSLNFFDTDVKGGEHPSLPRLDDEAAPTESKAKAYLHANCSHCHQPGGNTPTSFDLRFETQRDQMNVVGTVPKYHTLGLSSPKVVDPGKKENSVLWELMRRSQPQRMPPISTSVVDQQANTLIGFWIDTL